MYGRDSWPPENLPRRNFSFHVVPLWVNGNRILYPSAPLGVTFVMRHKSNQKDFFGTAQEGIKMTALRGKSRISLPLRLHISWVQNPPLPKHQSAISLNHTLSWLKVRWKWKQRFCFYPLADFLRKNIGVCPIFLLSFYGWTNLCRTNEFGKNLKVAS